MVQSFLSTRTSESLSIAGIQIFQRNALRTATIELGNLPGGFWTIGGEHSSSFKNFSTRKAGLGNSLSISEKASVGIGIQGGIPQRPLHVSAGSSSGPISSVATIIFEDNAGFHLQLSSPNNSQAGILSGNQQTSLRAGIFFTLDSAISFRSGGNNTTTIFLSKTGNVSIDGVLTLNSESG